MKPNFDNKNFTEAYFNFMTYYSIILEDSKIDKVKGQVSNTYQAYKQLIANRTIFINLSCNFLDNTFLELLDKNLLARNRLFTYIIYSCMIFQKFSFNFFCFTKKSSNVEKSQKVKNHNQNNKKHDNKDYETNIHLTIILYDLIKNIKDSGFEYMLNNSNIIEGLREAYSDLEVFEYNNFLCFLDKIFDSEKKLNNSIIQLNNAVESMFNYTGYSVLNFDGVFGKNYYFK